MDNSSQSNKLVSKSVTTNRSMPEQSFSYQQAKASWQKRWQHVMDECRDCFIRY